ncbi:hypothetical protein ACQEVB_02250 [Pseudonocardia sp. CA-107938]|uniref:hypothetical protein n=1 Tax=Pseudonocardia sp. CA-107938 TaxID=3240021 RepID=UPI003D8DA4F6
MITSIAEQRAIRALRAGQMINQFLGYVPSGPPGIAFVAVGPWLPPDEPHGLMVTVFEVVETYDEFSRPCLEDMPHLNKNERFGFGRDVGLRTTPRAALEFAESELGASRDRWVNQYKLEDQYEEWISAGRPPLR